MLYCSFYVLRLSLGHICNISTYVKITRYFTFRLIITFPVQIGPIMMRTWDTYVILNN
jgi:hypothetical protein